MCYHLFVLNNIQNSLEHLGALYFHFSFNCFYQNPRLLEQLNNFHCFLILFVVIVHFS